MPIYPPSGGSSGGAAVVDHEAAVDPHAGYLKENDASWTDLTDAGATTLHSHAGGGLAVLEDPGNTYPATPTVVAVGYQIAVTDPATSLEHVYEATVGGETEMSNFVDDFGPSFDPLSTEVESNVTWLNIGVVGQIAYGTIPDLYPGLSSTFALGLVFRSRQPTSEAATLYQLWSSDQKIVEIDSAGDGDHWLFDASAYTFQRGAGAYTDSATILRIAGDSVTFNADSLTAAVPFALDGLDGDTPAVRMAHLPETDPASDGQLFTMDGAGVAAAVTAGARYVLLSGGA